MKHSSACCWKETYWRLSSTREMRSLGLIFNRDKRIYREILGVSDWALKVTLGPRASYGVGECASAVRWGVGTHQ